LDTFTAEDPDPSKNSFFITTNIAIALGGRRIAYGTRDGKVCILDLEGSPLNAPIVTPTRLYRFDRQQWDTQLTVKCEWCGKRLAVDDQALDDRKNGQYQLDMSGQKARCSQCKRPLKINNFVVDNLSQSMQS
jgi:hypothetical protein